MSHHHSKITEKILIRRVSFAKVYGIIYSAPEQELALADFSKQTN